MSAADRSDDAHGVAVLRADAQRRTFSIECACGWVGEGLASAGLAWASFNDHRDEVARRSEHET